MIPNQSLISFPEFSTTGTKTAPAPVKYAAGFQAADVLPAEWLNYFINKASAGITAINSGLASIEAELNNIVTAAGETPSADTSNQVITAINSLRAVVTGSLDTLTTTAKNTLVAAINELVAKLGDLTALDTTVKTSIVAAINDISTTLGNAATKTAGSAIGNVPLIGGTDAFTIGANIPIVTASDGSIKLDSRNTPLGTASFKNAVSTLDPSSTGCVQSNAVANHVFYIYNEEDNQSASTTKKVFTIEAPITLVQGTVLKIWFKYPCRSTTVSSTEPYQEPKLKINGTEYAINFDTYTHLQAHNNGSNGWYWWYGNTNLEFMYYNGFFVILGNPVVISAYENSNKRGFRIHANGYTEQWGIINAKNYTSDTNFTVNFAFPFLTYIPTVNLTVETDTHSNNSTGVLELQGATKTGFSIYRPSTNDKWDIHYRAVGY